MGANGASSGIARNGKPYGTEYTTVYQSGNIKFLRYNGKSATAPMETMTQGRVYVTLGGNGRPKYITFYDKRNRRFKQIDLEGRPHVIDGVETLPHTHLGYNHDENGSREPTPAENKMVDRVRRTWQNRRRN